MRRVRDRRLPHPFREWIDRALPLPDGVVVLPRAVSVATDALQFAYPGLAMVGMGVFFTFLVMQTGGWRDGWALIFLVISWLILFGLPLLLARRLWQTIHARQDQRVGVLRQGVIVGREGVLIRLQPNCCYPIALDDFVKAEEWRGGGEDGTDHLRIVTTDGSIELIPDHLSVGAERVNHAVAGVRRSARSRKRVSE